MRILARCGDTVGGGQHARCAGNILARVEGVGDRHAEAGKVGAVDLHQSQVNGMVFGDDEVGREGDGFFAGSREVAATAGVVVDGAGVEAAFRAGDGCERIDVDGRPAACGELGEDGQRKDHEALPWPSD